MWPNSGGSAGSNDTTQSRQATKSSNQVARPALHLDFPRSEADSPRRPAAPWPTPRPPDRPRDRASDAAGGAPEQDEEEEEEDDGEEPARPRNRSTKVSL
ncbi:unnamed protein product [Prorocentrum cordatum]|uniref:Uncharacterized protein n=1 Tax=Prorocentrum cordatum TaxID=2364126 RepID=A0ABN9X499_9DINO|nr:unnamed protein product [Polarella glacialis]